MMISTTLAALLAASPEFLAQAPAPGGAPANPMGSQFFLFVPMIILMYFLMIRPQQKRQRELAALVASVKKGDRVLTTGGIYGYVAEVKDRTVTVTVATNVTIEMDKTSIAAVINPKTEDAVIVSSPATKARA